MTDVITVPSTLFDYIRNSLGLVRFERINRLKFPQHMARARAAITPESYKKRKYSKEGLASLRKHMREKVNTPLHYRTRNQDFRKDPDYLKKHSDKMKEQHRTGNLYPIVEIQEEKRINDHVGVITIDEMDSLDG